MTPAARRGGTGSQRRMKGGRALTEARIILLVVDAAVVFVAGCLFVRFLCDEYLRALVCQGLIRPRVPSLESPRPARHGKAARP